MTQVDFDIVAAWREMRRFCRQVQLMLATADGLMASDGWVNFGSFPRTCWGDCSQSISGSADEWLPQYFCRFYVRDTDPSILAYTSVILDEVSEPGLVSGALASAGWFDYGALLPKVDWMYYWFCKAHLWAKEREDNGKLCDGDLTKWARELRELKVQLQGIASFAVPLTEIQSEEDVDQRLVTRLKEGLARRNKSPD